MQFLAEIDANQLKAFHEKFINSFRPFILMLKCCFVHFFLRRDIQWRITLLLCYFAAHIFVSLSHMHALTAEAIIEKNTQYYHDDIMNWTVFELTLNIGIPLSGLNASILYIFFRLVKLFFCSSKNTNSSLSNIKQTNLALSNIWKHLRFCRSHRIWREIKIDSNWTR